MKKKSHRSSGLALAALIVMSWMIVACSSEPAEPPTELPESTPDLAPEPEELPKFTQTPTCNPSETSVSAPELPERWKAIALMQPFTQRTLFFGNFTYDQPAEAFRFIIANRYGAMQDLLVTQDQRLYLLKGGEGGGMPTDCSRMPNNPFYSMPTRDWSPKPSQCIGEAPILGKNQQWWKSQPTVGEEGGNWIWYNSDNKLPFRQMYYETPKQAAPVYEYTTFNYFQSFEKVGSTLIPRILELCAASSSTPPENFDLSDIESLVASSDYPTPHADSIAVIQGWIPELTECDSLGSLPPEWPEKTQATVFMTAVKYSANPFPTRVYYDWDRSSEPTSAQNSSLYYYPAPTTRGDPAVQIALLTGNHELNEGIGYIRIEAEDGSRIMCEGKVLPGPQVPNWMVQDNCECRAKLAPNSILNPSGEETKIVFCPTDASLGQYFWTWYSDTGRPVVFMQSNSSPTAGTGLNLADYTGWYPDSIAPEGTFTIPRGCKTGKPVPKACNNCHLPLNSTTGN